jgi:acyl-CoA synthetase (AMP-forming)/AMP-acid ligase II
MTPPPAFVHELLDAIGARSAPALTDAAGSWTFGDLQLWSRQAAAWLSGRGVVRGDRLLVRAVADKRIYALLYACSRVGAVFVPISPQLKAYQEAQIVRDSEPALEIGAEAVGPQGLTLDDAWTGVANTRAEGSAVRSQPDGPRDTAILFYTSGSTAEPKGVVAPHAQVVFAAHAIQERLRYAPGDVVYSRLPLNFDYGLYQGLLAALAPCAVVLADETAVDPAREIAEHDATVVPVVPALAGIIGRFALRRDPNRRVRLFTNTGDDLAIGTIRLLKQSFPRAAVQLMYGLTECKRVSILEPDGYEARAGAVGLPLRDTTARVVDDAGNELAVGNVGEIVVSGPHVTDGYWRDPELTRRSFGVSPETGERTLRTGDLGYLDADGYIYLHGRRDQIYKQRGVRTSVAEVEAAALDIPGVYEVALAPPRDGATTRLFVVADVTPQAVLRGIEERLGGAKLPDECRLVDSLPRGSTGKINRSALV